MEFESREALEKWVDDKIEQWDKEAHAIMHKIANLAVSQVMKEDDGQSL